MFLFFFKQKTAYEMRISDWSSDVCSSDLVVGMRMRIEDPLHSQPARRDMRQDRVRRTGRRRPRLLVEVEHRIDDGAAAGVGTGDDVLGAARPGIEER